MKPQFDNILMQSLVLWLDNKICGEGSGFVNNSSLLYRQPDTARNMISYASPYKQWVYDSCVAGSQIPSGVYNSWRGFI